MWRLVRPSAHHPSKAGRHVDGPHAPLTAGEAQKPSNATHHAADRFMMSVVIPLIASVMIAFTATAAAGNDGWTSARATRYGGLDDGWPIHDGACWHKYLSPNVKTGWDVAALPYDFPGFNHADGSCGRCFEVKCQNKQFKDGYGNWLDRGSVCYDEGASVVVQITDHCPCYYPSNAYSNKRWCCGDIPHMDLSTWAFEKLAEKKWGVIGIQYREVSCGTKPWKTAQLPNGQQPAPGHSPPHGFQDSWDPRPWPSSG